MGEPRNILVIKLSALGDFVQALGPFQAIREHHAGDRITLLTTRPFAGFAKLSPYFDAVMIDDRAPRWRIDKMLDLRRHLNAGRFDRVYDLQTSARSSFYYALFSPKPEWSGIARGCSHPHSNPKRDFMHTIERQAEQLRMAGIPAVPPPDLSWVGPALPCRYVAKPYFLVAPGGAAHRPDKRWPADRYAALAARLEAERGWTPVVVGTQAERAEADAILRACRKPEDMVGKTSLYDLVCLGRDAEWAVGNDTGPMHLFAATGCPCAVLYSKASDPALCGQRGKAVTILRRDDLHELTIDDVVTAGAGSLAPG